MKETLKRLEQDNLAALDLLRLCAFFDPSAIPEELMHAAARLLGLWGENDAFDTVRLTEALSLLQREGLLTYTVDARSWCMPLDVQQAVQETLEQESQRLWAEGVLSLINSVFPDTEHFASWRQCERYLPQALSCQELIERYDICTPEAGRLLYQMASYFYEFALYSKAEPLYKAALTIRKQALGPEHPDAAACLYNLARVYAAESKYEQAEPLHKRALTMREQVLGPQHPETARSLCALGEVYHLQGNYPEAKAHYEQALAIQDQCHLTHIFAERFFREKNH